MEARPTDGYIAMGTCVRYVADVQAGWFWYFKSGPRENIEWLLADLADNRMHVSLRMARPLAAAVQRIDSERDSSDNRAAFEKLRQLSQEEADEIRRHAQALRDTMLAEAEGQVAFITTDKRYDVKRLLQDIGSLMAPAVFDSLPELAQYDFAQAGKCIAYEVPTAAAFHTMRGTEEVLKHFYCSIIKRDRVAPMMWFNMTEHLGKRRTPPPQTLMANLDNLRKSFRNPTQHPDKVYEIEEAQDLFALSVDVVNRMMRHLADA